LKFPDCDGFVGSAGPEGFLPCSQGSAFTSTAIYFITLTPSGDDLSMFLAVGTLMHQLLTFDATPSRRRNITLLILGTIIPVSVYHVWADEIYVHELAFGIMVFITGRKIRKLIRERVTNPEARKRLKSLASLGTGTSVGFGATYSSGEVIGPSCPSGLS
jgi:hypothetical protein